MEASSSRSEERGTWSRKRSIKNKQDLLSWSKEDDTSTMKLDIIHLGNVVFADSVKYKTYRLHSRSQKYSGKMAARTSKVEKRMDTIMKPYKFENSDPVTKLSFLGQFKIAIDSNSVSEGVEMWLLTSFTARSPAASLTIWMTPSKDHENKLDGRRGVEVLEQIYAYVEATNYLLKSYVADDVIAKALTGIEALKNVPDKRL